MQRFWDKVDKSGDCWMWTGAVRNRYGAIRVDGKTWRAHRFVIVLEGSDIPSGMFVCHTCDTPLCVNPGHLFISDQAGNCADMVAKGRQTNGEKNGNAKLCEADVIAIRNATGIQKKIASEFGTTRQNIRNIQNRKSWKHI